MFTSILSRIANTLNDSFDTKINVKERIIAEANVRIACANLLVSVPNKLVRDIERAQKKAPPKYCRLMMLIMSLAEKNSSQTLDPIFKALLSPIQGRIYIGFQTHQTTGFAYHIGAPNIIPTVERESIDLVDPYIKQWNLEMLYTAGLLTRMIYTTEIMKVNSIDEALHLYKSFTFLNSNPSTSISTAIETAFYTATVDSSLMLYTSKGVKPSTKAKLGSSTIKFLQSTPLIDPSEVCSAIDFIEKAKLIAHLSDLRISDVLEELSQRTLTTTEGHSFFRWLLIQSEKHGKSVIAQARKHAVIITSKNAPISLNLEYQNLNPKIISPNLPIPNTVIPYEITQVFSKAELEVPFYQRIDNPSMD